ncbi:MAG: hypothetical protein AAGD17_06860 [Bacteroidota bacterium]
MSKVFRKNGLQVLKGNRFTKYLIYVMGEIILDALIDDLKENIVRIK